MPMHDHHIKIQNSVLSLSIQEPVYIYISHS